MFNFKCLNICILYFNVCHICMYISAQFTQACPTLCDPMDRSMPGFPVHHQLPESTQTHVHRVSCHPTISTLLLLPSIFPSITVFSNESVLRIRRPKHWSFSLSISPSNEYSGLISFRMDWLISMHSKGL